MIRFPQASLCLLVGIGSLGVGCAGAPAPTPEGNLSVEILSEPTGLEVTYSDQPIGVTPLDWRLPSLQETALLDLSQRAEGILERRIQVLSPTEVRVKFTFSEQPGDVARALGLTNVTVFDYGNRASFELNKFDLKPELGPMLDAQSALLNSQFQGLEAFVCGHTDSSGGEDHNRTLSIKRAQAVSDYLIGKGVEKGRLKIQGFGEDFPLASNDDEQGRALNRRTEIILADP